MILKAFKYRIYPNKEQGILISKHIGCCRYIYNRALETKIKEYQQNNKSLSYFDLQNGFLKKEKKEHEWLLVPAAQSLQMSLRNLDNAFTRFFRQKKGFPRFKSKRNFVQSVQFPQYVKVDFDNKRTIFPKLGGIRTIFHRRFKGKVKICTLSKTPTEKYYVSILVETLEKEKRKKKLVKKNAIGIDLGIKDFCVTSNGDKTGNPRHLRKSLDRLKVLQRIASRKKKGGTRRYRANKNVAKLHEKIANKRNDFLHKLSSKIIAENQTIVLEDLNAKGMMKNHCLAQCIADVSWSKFVEYLKYKAEWNGVNVLQIGRFDPSSKMCSCCGNINNELTLRDRKWKCSECNSKHDRDINAAMNILKFGFQKQNLVCSLVGKANLECKNTGSERPGVPVEIFGCKQKSMKRKESPSFREW